MFNIVCNKKGVSIVEVTMATMLVMLGVVGVLAVLPSGFKLQSKTDALGRAAGILHETMETNSMLLMNCCQALPATPATTTVRPSGNASKQAGDIDFTVTTTITSAGTNLWNLKVNVAWPTNPTGIQDSTLVSLQTPFQNPAGCTCAH